MANLYVCGLPQDGMDDMSFRSMFEAYGNIISCKCIPEKRYGFVKYTTMDEAQLAISGLTGFELGGSTIQVRMADNEPGKGGGGKFGDAGKGGFGGGGKGYGIVLATPGGGKGAWEAPSFGKGKGDKGAPPEPSTNLYIKGLPLGTNEELVQGIFGAYGTVSSCKVLPGPDGATSAACMVRMGTVDQATWLVDNLNGNIPQGLNDAVLVKFASSGGGKSKGKGDDAGGGVYNPAWGAVQLPSWNSAPAAPSGGPPAPCNNLYIKGLPVGMTEDFVREIFGAYGGIASVKVLPTPDNADNSAALVRFNDQAQATWLVDNLNGNIPKGLSCAVVVRYAAPAGGKGKDGKDDQSARFSPYGKGGGGPPVIPVNFGSGEEGSNLYVRGLPTTADDLYLYKVFAPCGAILSVKAVSAADKGGTGCAGYGFVKYATLECATKAMTLISSTPLPDGTRLQVSAKTVSKGKGDKAGPAVIPAKMGGAPPQMFPDVDMGMMGYSEYPEDDSSALYAAMAASGNEEDAAALAALS